MKSNAKGSIILILCSLVWGIAFSGQSYAMQYIGPFTFVFLRSIITCIVLFAVYPLFKNVSGVQSSANFSKKSYLGLGGLLGLFLVIAVTMQQVGLVYTGSTAKSGFVTALYIVIIPVIGIFMKKKIGIQVWIGVVVSLIGLYLLCMREDFTVNIGDVFTMISAFVFAFHIILIDKYASDMNSVLLSAIQFGVCAIASFPLMMIVEKPQMSSILSCWVSIIYTAVFSGAIGYTLQIIGQKYTEPTLASLLMCLESVFSAIGGWIILDQTLADREIIGCVLMLSASIIAQLPGRRNRPQALN